MCIRVKHAEDTVNVYLPNARKYLEINETGLKDAVQKWQVGGGSNKSRYFLQ